MNNLVGLAAGSMVPAYPVGSLFVGNLDPDITESMLYDKFSSAGSICSIRVCKDRNVKRSLRYAFVNYQQIEAAKYALDTMNLDLIFGKPCRIMWSEHNALLQTDSKASNNTLPAFGNTVSCQVKTDEKSAEGYGFVQLETEEAATKAIENMSGSMLSNSRVFAGKSMRSEEGFGQMGDRVMKFTNVYVRHIPEGMYEQQLTALFTRHGTVLSARVMPGDDSKLNRFGFVRFETTQAATECVSQMNGMVVLGRKLYVAHTKRDVLLETILRDRCEELKLEHDNGDHATLYVKHFADSVDDECLYKEFATYGKIISAKVMRDSSSVSKRFGFVRFSAQQEAAEAVTEMHGRIFGSRPLYVAFAQHKEDRKANLTAFYQQRQREYDLPTAATGHRTMSRKTIPVVPTMVPSGAITRPLPAQPTAAQPRMATPAASLSVPPMLQATQRESEENAAAVRINPASVQPAQPQAQQAILPEQEPLTAAMLIAAPPAAQKWMLGVKLFPLVAVMRADLAGKITATLLEIDNAELLHMLDSQDALKVKVDEAVFLLEAHKSKNAAGAGDRDLMKIIP